MMQLWLLKPINDEEQPWAYRYDLAHGFVVRATSPSKARVYASLHCGDEGPEVWKDTNKTSCKVLGTEGPPGMILRDYNAG